MDYRGKPEAPDSDALIASNLADHLRAGTLLIREPGSVSGHSVAWQGREGVPRMQSAGRFLAPEGRYLAFGQWAAPAELAAAAVAHIRAGARWAKVVADWPRYDRASAGFLHIPNYSEAALGAAVTAVHAAGGRVAVHCVGNEAAAIAIAAGVDSIEHGDYLDEDQLRECARRGIAWTPTVAMSERLAARMERTDEARRRYAAEREEQYRRLLPIAAREGVTILAGTDILPHGSVAIEVEALVRHGLEPRLALAAASTTARTFLREPGIEHGAPADLVVYQADPRDDPEVLREPALVMLAGKIVSRMGESTPA